MAAETACSRPILARGAFAVMLVTIFTHRTGSDVGADHGRAVSFDHVPDDLHARHHVALVRLTEEGFGSAHHGDRWRRAGGIVQGWLADRLRPAVRASCSRPPASFIRYSTRIWGSRPTSRRGLILGAIGSRHSQTDPFFVQFARSSSRDSRSCLLPDARSSPLVICLSNKRDTPKHASRKRRITMVSIRHELMICGDRSRRSDGRRFDPRLGRRSDAC